MGKFNYDRAAAVLVEAAYYGDKQAAERYGLSVRTIENYRARLEEDTELVAFFALKKQDFEDSWADELPAAIRSSIRFLAHAANAARLRGEPESQMVHSIAGALKILADVTLTKQVLDARLTGRSEPEHSEDREMASDPAADPSQAG